MDRLAIVEVSDSLVLHTLRHGTPATEVVEGPLPEDADLVAVELAGEARHGKRIRLTFRSEAFPPIAVDAGAVVPIINPGFKRG